MTPQGNPENQLGLKNIAELQNEIRDFRTAAAIANLGGALTGSSIVIRCVTEASPSIPKIILGAGFAVAGLGTGRWIKNEVVQPRVEELQQRSGRHKKIGTCCGLVKKTPIC